MRHILSVVKNELSTLAGDRSGQTMTEYALAAGFLAAVLAVVLSTTGNNVKTSFINMDNKLAGSVADSATPVANSPSPSDDNSADSGDNGGDGGSGASDNNDGGGDSGSGDDSGDNGNSGGKGKGKGKGKKN